MAVTLGSLRLAGSRVARRLAGIVRSTTLRRYAAFLSILWLALTTLAQERGLREGITRAARNAVAATEALRPLALLELISKHRDGAIPTIVPDWVVEAVASIGPLGSLLLLILMVLGGLLHVHEAGWWGLVPLGASAWCGVVAARTIGMFFLARLGSPVGAAMATIVGGLLAGAVMAYLIRALVLATLHSLGLIAAFVGYIGVGVLTIDKGVDLWQKLRTVWDAARASRRRSRSR